MKPLMMAGIIVAMAAAAAGIIVGIRVLLTSIEVSFLGNC